MNDPLPMHERRATDIVTTLLIERINGVETHAAASNADTLSRVDAHIAECKDTQKWVLRGMVGIFAWVVLHSPEVLGLGAKIIAGAGK